MAAVDRTVASLRIIGDDLDPQEITRLLGHEPTKSKRKGDTRAREHPHPPFVVLSGSWSLRSSEQAPGDLDAQIDEILSKLSSDLEVWRGISNRFRVDLFCGMFMSASNEGLSISASSLAALGNRGIELDLDIYDGQFDALHTAGAQA